jgi:hypothetical protein
VHAIESLRIENHTGTSENSATHNPHSADSASPKKNCCQPI